MPHLAAALNAQSRAPAGLASEATVSGGSRARFRFPVRVGRHCRSSLCDAKGEPVDADPVDQLDREWRQLAHGPLRARMPTWVSKEPALARFSDPLALIRFLRAGDGWAEKDCVLAAL